MESNERPKFPRISRRRFLKYAAYTVAGIGVAAVAGALKPSGITETKGSQPVQSPHFATAMDAVSKKVENPNTKDTIQAILENIDNQGITDLSVYRSSQFPGVEFPVTAVNLNRLFESVFSPDRKKITAPTNERVFVIFPGFSWPKSGHPFTPWDMVYDRAFKALPRIASAIYHGQNPEQTQIIIPGSPNSWWGSVTPKWVEELKNNGLSPYARLYQEYLVAHLPPENRAKTSLILQGISLGAAVAKFTAEELAQLKPKFAHLQLRMDNPVGLENFSGLSPAQAQIVLGFIAEGVVRTFYTDRGKAQARDEGPFYDAANRVLSARGIKPKEEDNQNTLKEAAAKVDITNLLKGPHQPVGTEVRAYSAQGIYDPLSFSLDRLNAARSLKSAGKLPVIGIPGGLEILTESTHSIDRLRVVKWARAVESIQRNLSKAA